MSLVIAVFARSFAVTIARRCACAAWLLAQMACGPGAAPASAPALSFPSDGGAPASDDSGSEGELAARPAAPLPSTCIAKEDLPRSCDEVCADQGSNCNEACDFGTPLPAVAGYYASLGGCEAGHGVVFAVTARCDERLDRDVFLPYGAVRCCCGARELDAASAAERTPLCDAACAKDPYPDVPECTMFGGCQERCLEATGGVDLDCARCIIDKVGFSPSGCSSWECVCGGASFPSLWNVCEDACSASRQHQRELYEAKPRPAPLGRVPVARLDAPDIPEFADLMVDERGWLWAAGTTRDASAQSRVSVAVFDADLTLRWRWDDPAQRAVRRSGQIARLGEHSVVAATFVDGTATLLFFDAEGDVREQPTSLSEAQAITAFEDLLLIKHVAGELFGLTLLDAQGQARFSAPLDLFDQLEPTRWVHAVHADRTWSLVSSVESALRWRRVALPADFASGSASILWTQQLQEDGGTTPVGAGAASDDVLVWGAQSQRRGTRSGGFPWLARFGSDGSARWRWSNGELVTPGRVLDAVQAGSDITCSAGEESWEDAAPATGPRCSPDGCEALTVRCFDADGNELWHYHHRSERSAGYAIAAGPNGQLYVGGTTTRDRQRSSGLRAVLLQFAL